MGYRTLLEDGWKTQHIVLPNIITTTSSISITDNFRQILKCSFYYNTQSLQSDVGYDPGVMIRGWTCGGICESVNGRYYTCEDMSNARMGMERGESVEAEERHGTRIDLVEYLPPSYAPGKMRDKVATKLGISGKQYEVYWKYIGGLKSNVYFHSEKFVEL